MVPAIPEVMTLPLTEWSSDTAIVLLPAADVATAGTS
jgi:hypothetical protein